jgi:CRISPR-associated protein Cmr2
MSEVYWQAKIWGLLHDPPFKALSNSMNFDREGGWHLLKCMEGWHSPKDSQPQEKFSRAWLDHLGLSDLIASASDRSTIGRLPAKYSSIAYNQSGLAIHHLLSGKKQTLQISQWHQDLLKEGPKQFLEEAENSPLNQIKDWDDPQKVFWWLWRVYPQLLTEKEPKLNLLPAETRIPDTSLWSHVSMTAALTGGLAGYYENQEDYPKKGKSFSRSRPYVGIFSFAPIQELIKASRKMRDFWAGSWLLHYLAAKVAYAIATKYGPDTLLYPCLYQQPLIDHWLLKTYPDFSQWIQQPSDNQMLTAGFPNVLVMILPDNGKNNEAKDNPIHKAMQYAEQILHKEWRSLGEEVLQFLQLNEKWRQISQENWNIWLKSQWQTYWTALPLGTTEQDLAKSPRQKDDFSKWVEQQNKFANPQAFLFETNETQFLEAVFGLTIPADTEENNSNKNLWRFRQPNINVGSWWASLFDQVRYNLSAIKNARTWQIPTAFGPRSTISGIGPVVHPIYQPNRPEWATEGETKRFWENNPVGLFDGIEELNATEVLKRGLHQKLGKVLGINNNKIPMLYPDLSSGVAGWLKQEEGKENNKTLQYYHQSCKTISETFLWANKAEKEPWGIPWIEKNHSNWSNPRLLNSGWLIEDYASESNEEIEKEAKRKELTRLRQKIAEFFSAGNNPTDWYVLAAGDGDGMGDWLKGGKLESYEQYIPESLKEKIGKMPSEFKQPIEAFLKVKKRMGPATHSALSRALLDFSNQLVPYLTQERYAGRLIYGGGDDVLAYSNLWEWDSWLWDIRQCFCGQDDPQNDFISQGDYWQWKSEENLPKSIVNRPLFTMGSRATISFGIVIAHHSVPLAIALENMWEAETEAKEHYCINENNKKDKDAVQVRVLYGTGNILKATAKFDVFNQWRQLLSLEENGHGIESAIYEQAVEIWQQYSAPRQAINAWTKAFCERRENLNNHDFLKSKFRANLTQFIESVWDLTAEDKRNKEIQNWLKLAAFVKRNRQIKIPTDS